MVKKRLDVATLQLMNLDKSPNAENLYEFDEPITKVRIFKDEYGGQGLPPFYAIFFNGDKVLLNVAAKGNFVSKTLTAGDENSDGSVCADPRIIATYILGAWLDYAFCNLKEYDKEKELPEALNPIFTRDEALEWLEKCGFIGVDNYNNPFHEKDRSKWFIENPSQPGFDIYLDEPDIPAVFVPPKARKLYDKYIKKFKTFAKENDF